MHKTVLKNCVEQLKKLRDATYSQLDASIRLEFDEVIALLERVSESEASEVNVGPHLKRALELIALVVEVATNITDLVKALFGD